MLALGAIAPLLALVLWLNAAQSDENLRQTTQRVQSAAHVTAVKTRRSLERVWKEEELLETELGGRMLDPLACKHLRLEFISIERAYREMFVLDAAGHPLCTGEGGVATPPAAGSEAYLSQLGEPALLGAADSNSASGERVVSLAHRIRDKHGVAVGMLGVSLDLSSQAFGPARLVAPELTEMLIIDEKGTLVAATPPARAGFDYAAWPVRRGLHGIGTVRERGIDGVDRIYGFAPVEGTRWYAVGGVDANTALEASRARWRWSLVAAAAVLALAAALIYAIAATIARPAAAIAATTRGAPGGPRLQLLKPSGPREIRAIFEAIREMLQQRDTAIARLDETKEQLNRSRERLSTIVDSAMDAVVSVDRDGRVVLFNRAAERMFGRAAADVIGGPLDVLIPTRFNEAHAGHVQRVAAAGDGSQPKGPSGHVWGRRADGSEFPVEASISALNQDGSMLFTAILRDVTQRVQTQQLMREQSERVHMLNRRLLDLQEVERRSLARELHDRVAQDLATLKMSLALADPAEPPEALIELLQLARTLTHSALQQSRDILEELHPPGLDEQGLAEAIRLHVQTLEERFPVSVEVRSAESQPRLPRLVEIALFRIAQEALSNACRHAGARRITVDVELAWNGVFRLCVADDGNGFDKSLRRPRSYGLLMMSERAEAIGASFEIESHPGRGTTVCVVFAG